MWVQGRFADGPGNRSLAARRAAPRATGRHYLPPAGSLSQPLSGSTGAARGHPNAASPLGAGAHAGLKALGRSVRSGACVPRRRAVRVGTGSRETEGGEACALRVSKVRPEDGPEESSAARSAPPAQQDGVDLPPWSAPSQRVQWRGEPTPTPRRGAARAAHTRERSANEHHGPRRLSASARGHHPIDAGLAGASRPIPAIPLEVVLSGRGRSVLDLSHASAAEVVDAHLQARRARDLNREPHAIPEGTGAGDHDERIREGSAGSRHIQGRGLTEREVVDPHVVAVDGIPESVGRRIELDSKVARRDPADFAAVFADPRPGDAVSTGVRRDESRAARGVASGLAGRPSLRSTTQRPPPQTRVVVVDSRSLDINGRASSPGPRSWFSPRPGR